MQNNLQIKMTKAEKIVEFLSELHGLTPCARHGGTLDLANGAVITSADGFPEGDMLKITYANGEEHFIPSKKVMDFYLVRHAQTESIIDDSGGKEITAQDEYQHIEEHFIQKTGFGQ